MFGGWGRLCGFGGVVTHVLFEGALIAESIVARRGFLVEETIKAFCGAVARDGGVVTPTVCRVVFGLGVSALPADSAPFVGFGSRAGVYVVGQ